jgi:hypothetical protein
MIPPIIAISLLSYASIKQQSKKTRECNADPPQPQPNTKATDAQKRTLLIFCEFRGQTITDLLSVSRSAPKLYSIASLEILQNTTQELVANNLLRERDSRFYLTKSGLAFILN